MAVDDRSITFMNISWVGEDDDLCNEAIGFARRVVSLVSAYIPSPNIFLGYISNAESDVVSCDRLRNLFMVDLNCSDFRFRTRWGKVDWHIPSQNSSFNSAHYNGSNPSNFVDVMDWDA